MLSKKEYLIKFLENNNTFICPLCKENLRQKSSSLVCCNNHTFDYTKKGSINLIKANNYKASNIYTKELFINRRNFINNNFYKDVYLKVAEILNNFAGNKQVSILDVGCGEGTHSMKILELLKFTYLYYGFDYSLDGVNLATDYNGNNKVFFQASVVNIPLKDNSIDIIIDFLSPHNYQEYKRVLKKNGIIIKVSPGSSYLLELRKAMNIGIYEKETQVYNNILNKFSAVCNYKLKKSFELDEEQTLQLVHMTPMQKLREDIIIKNITIDLNIYVLKVKDN